MADPTTEEFEANRPRLAAIAYRMLGSVAEAEDVVQDTYLRWHRTPRETVRDAGAFLAQVATRLALDRLKRASRQRESYVGPWLPEPIVAEAGTTGPVGEEIADDVSFALMLALERLSPLERAAFLLHDAFELDFDEIATALGRSPAACRQLASRARAHVRTERPRFAVDADERERISEAFFAAARSGDVAALKGLLAADVSLRTDGGGRKVAALNVITGSDRVARFFAGLARKQQSGPPLFVSKRMINGLAGEFTVEVDGTRQTIALEIGGNHVTAVYVTRNPDKLRHLERLVPPELAG